MFQPYVPSLGPITAVTGLARGMRERLREEAANCANKAMAQPSSVVKGSMLRETCVRARRQSIAGQDLKTRSRPKRGYIGCNWLYKDKNHVHQAAYCTLDVGARRNGALTSNEKARGCAIRLNLKLYESGSGRILHCPYNWNLVSPM